jgi:hypothetical protein
MDYHLWQSTHNCYVNRWQLILCLLNNTSVLGHVHFNHALTHSPYMVQWVTPGCVKEWYSTQRCTWPHKLNQYQFWMLCTMIPFRWVYMIVLVSRVKGQCRLVVRYLWFYAVTGDCSIVPRRERVRSSTRKKTMGFWWFTKSVSDIDLNSGHCSVGAKLRLCGQSWNDSMIFSFWSNWKWTVWGVTARYHKVTREQ